MLFFLPARSASCLLAISAPSLRVSIACHALSCPILTYSCLATLARHAASSEITLVLRSASSWQPGPHRIFSMLSMTSTPVALPNMLRAWVF